ncbi:MAG: hypothetical protein EZS26_003438 [Candidatus Ordinivivax streblomastigis]|uniref:Uncharacterized protein n=1 Tax=Candidatus Ordinivivax streblomastigis TaxID=2540710 RepID=A0A5M8NVN8_9BACT|nr:MAG: hypothetical protein EZS26_003438 [Candidatus Ordinivivax streblomastigis]
MVQGTNFPPFHKRNRGKKNHALSQVIENKYFKKSLEVLTYLFKTVFPA